MNVIFECQIIDIYEDCIDQLMAWAVQYKIMQYIIAKPRS